jgi:FkbM family methyltransferase
VLYSFLLKLIQAVLGMALMPLGSRRRTFVQADLSACLAPIRTIETTHGALRFYCPSKLTVWRANTLLTKEPETISWIDSFGPQDVLWDIGANVGLYTIYAAARGIRVLAFEPSAWNSFVLNRNIEINGMGDRVTALPVAFGAKSGTGSLVSSAPQPGSALNEFRLGTELRTPSSELHAQGAIGYTLDDFVDQFDVELPDHLKIDVDGLEPQIVAGGTNFLCSQRLRSVSIEIDSEQQEAVDAISRALETAGFRLAGRRHGQDFEVGPWQSIYNYLFVR